MKKILALLLAVGVVGSAFAAGGELKDVTCEDRIEVQADAIQGLENRLHASNKRLSFFKATKQMVTVDIENLIANGYIKPKNGVELVYGFGPGYVVADTWRDSFFALTNDGIEPIMINGKLFNENHEMGAFYPSYKEFRAKSDACRSGKDLVKIYDCLINLAATI